MSSGHHIAAWRHPDARADDGLNFQHYRQITQTAERGKFDMIFFADGVAVWNRGPGTEALKRTTPVHFEPLTLLSALSTVTEHIGLAATVSTTYNEPYHLARKFASLDHLSGDALAGILSPPQPKQKRTTSAKKSTWIIHCAINVLKNLWMW